MESNQLSIVKNRIQRTAQHISPNSTTSSRSDRSIAPESCKGQEGEQAVRTFLDTTSSSSHQGKQPLKWNGWGYTDTQFAINEKGDIYLTGSRYDMSGVAFPKLRAWAEQNFGMDMNVSSPANVDLPLVKDPIKHQQFLEAIKGNYAIISFDNKDRIFHAHGCTTEDIFRARYSNFHRIPDVVIWPGKHEHVEVIIREANKYNVVVIPYGGGTSVASALECPNGETRMVVSLDMHEMNRIKWIDHHSLIACVECGIVGKDLDEKLAKLGYLMGHEPDSSEFSSLGGWIATRASGMKKNTYGNIEDILVTARMVTPIGTIEKGCNVPRISSGPDVNHIILGSEGTLGVITEAVIKVRPLPECRRYGSIVFPDFESGVAFLREIARHRCAPTSIRLVDNAQFQFGQVLKPEGHSAFSEWVDAAKKWYVTQYKGFQIDKMVAATLLFEGNKTEAMAQEKKVFEIAARYGGLSGGEEAGKRGYFLTYMIAYIRDLAFQYWMINESFETSVPWSNVLAVCTKTKQRINDVCKGYKIKYPPFVTCRVTQLYDVGAAVYFYFGFIFKDVENPLDVFNDIENQARDEIMKNGGSISHHHGVGKLRKQYMPQTVSETGMDLLKGVKLTLDPNNVFANGNLM